MGGFTAITSEGRIAQLRPTASRTLVGKTLLLTHHGNREAIDPYGALEAWLVHLLVAGVDIGAFDLMAKRRWDAESARRAREILRRLVASDIVRLLPQSEPAPIRHEHTLAYLSRFAPNGGGEHDLLARIQSAVVLIAGVSGLGSWIATGLALLGAGELRLVDFDVVRGSHLNRTLLLHESDVGRGRASALAQRLTESSSSTRVLAFTHDLAGEALPSGVIDGADVVISAVDKPGEAVQRLIAQACVPRGIPFVCPSGNRVGPFYIGPGTACALCEHAEQPDWQTEEEAIAGQGWLPPAESGAVPHVAAAAAAVVLQDTLRVITGINAPATKNHIWVADANLEATRIPRPSYAGCPACHPSG